MTTLSSILTFGAAGTGHHADGRRCQLQQGPELTEGLPVGAPDGDERSVEVQPTRDRHQDGLGRIRPFAELEMTIGIGTFI